MQSTFILRFSNYLSSLLFITSLLLSTSNVFGQSGADSEKEWVGTWATAPQLVEPGNMPPSLGLSNNSLRQVVRVSIGGNTLRVKLSNEFSTNAVTMKSVQIAVSTGGHTINTTTNKELTFNGSPEVTMNAGSAITSDPIEFELEPRMDVAITIFYGQTSGTVTGHPGSRTTSYLLEGNNTSNTNFSGSIQTEHWYNINQIHVLTSPPAASIAILGNSITDGRGSTTNQQNRWPDIFSEELLKNSETQHIGVLNMGIGGNAVLAGGLGPTGLSRYDRDILNQPGVQWAIIYHGVNDIGGVKTAQASITKANELISAYKQMIVYAHQRKIRIYGGTILPFNGSSYHNQHSESCRTAINEWIRNSNWFDAVIDFDETMRNPNDITRLISSYQNDGLHPDAAGYKKMGESIDINLFIGFDTDFSNPELTGSEWHWFEAERFVPELSNFLIKEDPLASNNKYIEVIEGLNSPNEAPNNDMSTINIPFTIIENGDFNVFARLNCPTYDDDSFWIKLNNESFAMSNGLVTSGWEWKKLNNYFLEAGDHTITIAYREDGAKLDKLCITNNGYTPLGIGGSDSGVEDANVGYNTERLNGGYGLGQNYPNPFDQHTHIPFKIPSSTFVSLKIYNSAGLELAGIANHIIDQGSHTAEFNSSHLPNGIYLYTIETDNYFASKKMIIMR